MLPVLLLLLLDFGSNERKFWLGSEVCCLESEGKDNEGEVRALVAPAFEAVILGKEQCLRPVRTERHSLRMHSCHASRELKFMDYSYIDFRMS